MNRGFKDMPWVVVAGVVIGLVATTLVLLVHSNRLAHRVAQLQNERQRMEYNLTSIEDSMIKLDQYRSQIDQLASATVTTDQAQVSKLKKQVRSSYQNPAEKIENQTYRLDTVASEIAQVEQTLRAASSILALRKDVLRSIPSITPTEGWVSSSFGGRKSPFSGEEVNHRGLDIGAEHGTPVLAPADGIVDIAMRSETFGNLLVIKHADDIITKMAHNEQLLVKKGERVVRGQKVALVGSTGRSTGPHLHYEVIVGDRQVDPMSYLLDRELVASSRRPLLDRIGGEVEKTAAQKIALEHKEQKQLGLSYVIATLMLTLGFVAILYVAIFGSPRWRQKVMLST